MRNLFKWLMVGLVTIPGSSASIIQTEPTTEASIEEVEIEVETLMGSNLNPTEKKVLDFFIERGIKDKMALAVLLGNIKQESLFITNICEGGARVPYHRCHSGGFGLIQWTTTGRYGGLGRHANNIEGGTGYELLYECGVSLVGLGSSRKQNSLFSSLLCQHGINKTYNC